MKHQSNATSKDKMKIHWLYSEYPASGVANLVAAEGCFESLQIYCCMAYDKGSDTSPLHSDGEAGSLFAWSKQTTYW